MRVEFYEDEVFQPKKNGQPREPDDYKPVKDVFFTLRGSHDFMYEDMPALTAKSGVEFSKEACARKKGTRYYIRMNLKGEIYNPFDPSHLMTASKFENNLPVWRYINVAYTCFKSYILFLQTRNPLYLTWTRREIGAAQ